MTAGVHVYLYRRLVRDVWPHGVARRRGRLLFIVLGMFLFLGVPLARFMPPEYAKPLAVTVFGYMGVLGLLLPALIVLSILKGGYLRVRPMNAPTDQSRRQLLSRGVAAATVLGSSTAAASGVRAAFSPEVTRVDVPMGAPRDLTGLQIAQLSDVHIGPTLGEEFLDTVVKQTNALEPDLVVITGDLVDGKPSTLGVAVSKLGELRSRYGTFFVTGNHEYYSGANEWIEFLTGLGIRVLRNETIELVHNGAKFDLIGVDDWRAARSLPGHGYDLKKATANRDPSRTSILLSHQPKAIHDAAEAKIDLVLSGHTHGGQIWPYNFIAHLVHPYVRGLHQHSERTWIYVHKGTGFWGPPVRLGAAAEVALLTLR